MFRNRYSLAELHDRLQSALASQSCPYEIIFVNDACPDGSGEELQKLERENSSVSLVWLKNNLGQQKAILRGLSQARGDRVVLLDADLQDPPEAVPQLLQKAEEGYDVVFAGRRGEFDSFFRLWTSRIFKGLLSALLGIPKDVGLFFVISRPVVDYLNHFEAPGPSVLSMIGIGGFSHASIPVLRSRRVHGRSSYDFFRRVKLAFVTLLWIIQKKLRIRA